jgi:uncharacterized protein
VTALQSDHPEPRIEIVRPGRWLQVGSPAGFEWARVPLPIKNLSPKLVGLRILHLADLHLKNHWWPVFDELHQMIAQNRPDLILCTGDFVEHKWMRKPTLPVLQRFIDGLTARLGVWGILGNHDGDLLAPNLMNYRLHLLNGARTLLETNDDVIELIGTPGVYRGDLDDEFLHSIPPKQAGRLRIVMQHYPDQIKRTGTLEPDMVLAGHTHGGQVCLPGGHPLMKHDSLPARYCQGVHQFGSSWLIVSRGFGFSSLPIRAFCSSQVMEIVLEKRED